MSNLSGTTMASSNAAVASDVAKPPVLEVIDLKKHFPVKKGIFQSTVGHVFAVDGVRDLGVARPKPDVVLACAVERQTGAEVPRSQNGHRNGHVRIVSARKHSVFCPCLA